MYASIDAHADNPALKVTIVADRNTPGLCIQHGPLYLSLTVAEAVDLIDAVTGALAELEQTKTEQPGPVRRDENGVRQAAEVREDLGLADNAEEVGR